MTWRFGLGGTGALLDGFAAAAAGGVFLLIPFLMRGAGGGDVKMLFAAGAVVGWGRVLMMLWITSLTGIVFGIAMLIFGKLDGIGAMLFNQGPRKKVPNKMPATLMIHLTVIHRCLKKPQLVNRA